ncbi:uncharacterized protein LOC122004918 [Zingiber officinale]|uniref:DSBA-like thioredoxin domain-containing protein n=1 Tax=Zingiber officinale TaxID=94328 RepID=A0A8J5KQV4_ZINOF|nr:uncharacterized protein LOC122004918 [Zingiber officinale]KAG6488447.1 hypothetical protein ZIOFF_049690 [Zingiber officinale]
MAERAALLFPRLLLGFFFFVLFTSCVFASGIPSKYDGFYYSGGGEGWEDVIVVDAFLDPLCPDSRDSWPTLKKVVELYSPLLAVIVHPFPLPYHSNSFLACRALHIANKLNASSTFPFLELFFRYQEKYYNAPTKNITRTAMIEDMANLSIEAVGNSLSEFLSGFDDQETDLATRISFKYGCSRGVYGAPFFFVNGFLLPDAGSALDFATWKNIIDPLLAKHKKQGSARLLSFLM